MTDLADPTPLAHAVSYGECSARVRIAHLFDAGSFVEWLPPSARVMSPHLAQLGVPSAFDDGVAIGSALLGGHVVFIAAQEGEFMGGGVGEVHGAKLVGLMQRALRDKPEAVLLLAESGGVRLHEANAGLIAVSEVMRALLDVRASGIPVIVLIGGANGCFGGMGIVARCADHIIMSDIGRLAMSGPEVIEASHGVEEFDSRDRALVWRTTGGKHRYLLGDCDQLVADDVAAFRRAALAAVVASETRRVMTLDALQAEHALLAQRLVDGDGLDDAVELWRHIGIDAAAHVPDLDAAQVAALRSRRRAGGVLPTDVAAADLLEALS
jgi:malonate decarboxylase beta subunit